ncbi:hypothetical protein D3C81_664780 [compost metagenome]
MRTTFVLQLTICASAVNHKDNLFKTAQVAFIHVHNIDAPALRIGIPRIHPVQIGGKQSRFVPSGRTANFHDDVLIVVRILRQQQYANLLFQLLLTCAEFLDLHLHHFAHFIIQLLGLHDFSGFQLFDDILIFGVRLISRL